MDDYQEGNDDIIDTRDPFKCTIQIQSGMNNLREIFNPLLQWIDPVFQFVNLKSGLADLFQKTSQATTFGSNYFDRRNYSQSKGTHHASASRKSTMETQALSLVLFLHEDNNPLSAQQIQAKLKLPPWKYHHSQYLGNTNHQQRNLSNTQNQSSVNPTSMARQDFYAISPNLPLWAISSVHCGNEVLRFNIFTRDHQSMKQFYSILLNDQPTFDRQHFCLFTIYSQPGLCIQLSLKHDPTLLPIPVQSAFLQFRVHNMNQLSNTLTSSQFNCPHGRTGWWTTYDPDGNFILLQDDQHDINLHNAEIASSQSSTDGLTRPRYQSSICSSDSHDSGACSGENEDTNSYQDFIKKQLPPSISEGIIV